MGPLGEDFPLSRIDELNQGNVTIKPDVSTTLRTLVQQWVRTEHTEYPAGRALASLAGPIDGSRGRARDAAHPRSNLFHFHAVFRKKLAKE